jgi:hypothetical protein
MFRSLVLSRCNGPNGVEPPVYFLEDGDSLRNVVYFCFGIANCLVRLPPLSQS